MALFSNADPDRVALKALCAKLGLKEPSIEEGVSEPTPSPIAPADKLKPLEAILNKMADRAKAKNTSIKIRFEVD